MIKCPFRLLNWYNLLIERSWRPIGHFVRGPKKRLKDEQKGQGATRTRGSSMVTREIIFSVRGLRVSGVLHLPHRKSPPCVVVSHGLLSSKESEKYVELSTRLCREDFAVLRFDFLGCGKSQGKLKDSTITGRLGELGAAISFVRTERALGDAIGLMGSSLGGIPFPL